MSCCRSNQSLGKSLFYILLLLLCVFIAAALPDMQRYLRIRKM